MIGSAQIRTFLALTALGLITAVQAQQPNAAEDHPGAGVFRDYCSACHLEQGAIGPEQAPPLRMLQTMDAASLEFAAPTCAILSWPGPWPFPGVSALRSSPVIVGSTLFFSATGSRRVLAIDAELGCAKWVFHSPDPATFFFDLWRTEPRRTPRNRLWGRGRFRLRGRSRQWRTCLVQRCSKPWPWRALDRRHGSA